jgi:MraZ protein
VRHLLLYGEYELTIDEKNRLLVPAEIRRQIDPERDGEAFFMVIGVNKLPWLYPERYYEDLVSRKPPDWVPAKRVLDFYHMNFGMASRLEWDKQGRMLIPDKWLKENRLGKEVTLLGSLDHLELWNTSDWTTRRQTLLEQSSEIALQTMQPTQQTP